MKSKNYFKATAHDDRCFALTCRNLSGVKNYRKMAMTCKTLFGQARQESIKEETKYDTFLLSAEKKSEDDGTSPIDTYFKDRFFPWLLDAMLPPVET